MKTIIKTAIALKISLRGSLKYCIKIDKHNNLYIQIVENISKTDKKGTFSKEDISFSLIKKLLESESNKSIPSMELNPLFTSISNNNAPFLAAILRYEGILEKVGSDHLIRRDVLAKWEAKTLAEALLELQNANADPKGVWGSKFLKLSR
jgi:hypothetical protein